MAQGRVPAKIKRALEEMPDDYIECRDFGHAMRHVAQWWTQKARGRVTEICRQAKCIRCGTYRLTYYTYPHMERVGSTYQHAPGYLVNLGKGRVPRVAVIAESIRRGGPILDGPPPTEVTVQSLIDGEAAL
jgi:hypothetical protein